MARLPPGDPQCVPQALRESALFRVLSLRPQIARTAAAHLAAVTGEGVVPQRTKELCALMVSWLNACEY